MHDQLQATQACKAFQSFKQRTNPGNIRLTADTVYPVVEKNKPDATHYRLKIAGAAPELRWVAIDCGNLLGNNPPTAPISPAPKQPIVPQRTRNVLAISWQPAFCETHPNKTECQTQTADRFDATNFTLHGLWPEKTYCHVSEAIKNLDKPDTWLKMPKLNLSAALLNELRIKMPGAASGLHLHEWYKHGSCYSATPEEYYRESLALLDQVNASSVRAFFVKNIDRQVRSQDIRTEFSDAFSDRAGEKIEIACERDDRPTRRRMIQELQLNLKGEVASDTLIADLFKDANSVGAGCLSGEVDRAGLN
jgi:ribonuclease T2